MKRIAVVLLCGAALGVGCRDADGGGRVASFEQVCLGACRAMYSEPCQGIDSSQCGASCAAADEALAGPCADETFAMYRCSATLSFECTDDGPQATEYGCLEETMAFVECLDHAPCLGHCQAAAEAGCGSSEEACLAACATELESAGFCDHELEDLFECQGVEGVDCVDGQPVSRAACSAEEALLEECLADP